jgi:hypothetical protein
MKHRLILLTVIFLLPFAANSASSRHDRDGLRMTIDLSGEWMAALDADHRLQATDPFSQRVMLPGTTDTNHLGFPPTDTTVTDRLTRRYSFKGRAWYSRQVTIPRSWAGKTIVLTLERTKTTEVFVDGQPCGGSNDIVAPQRFDLTACLTPGEHRLTISVDNGRGVPDQLYQSSHQLCEDTQTNWNGIIGQMTLQAMNPCHITGVDVRPKGDGTAIVLVNFVGEPDKKTQLEVIVTDAEKKPQEAESPWRSPGDVHLTLPILKPDSVGKKHTLSFLLNMKKRYRQWSEWQPARYRLTVRLTGKDEWTQNFGFVDFQSGDGHFMVNGHPTFLRGKHDGCVFPLTAHSPMDRQSWTKYFDTCRQYGINHVRFHSWCPPEAAFAVADSLGIYLQPELPFWGNFDKKDTVLMGYLLQEGKRILRAYGGHPSFRMMSLGNELWGDIDVMQQFMRIFRTMAPDKLYTIGTNYYLGYKGIVDGMDYITTCRLGREEWGSYNTHTRGSFSFADAKEGGIINNTRPGTVRNFDEACDKATVPVVSHETGQFQSYPDYDQIKSYTGVLKPYNLQEFKRRLQRAGMADEAKAFHEASGLWSKELYKADMEMDLRTRRMAGFQLLDLQDYPGQGSAYIGMLDAFMQSKGFTTPEEWRQWCSPIVPLALMDSVCWANSKTLNARIQVANYSGKQLDNCRLKCSLNDGDRVIATQTCGTGLCAEGLTEQGSVAFPLGQVSEGRQLTLSITFVDDAGKEQPSMGHNIYKVWVYPDCSAKQLDLLRQGIVVTHQTDEALAALRQGERVLLMAPFTQAQAEGQDSLGVQPSTTDGKTLPGLFTTDYWNYKMFKNICLKNHKEPSPGTLGLYIANVHHPLFDGFPTDNHTSWQWYPVVKASTPVILDSLPGDVRPLVQVIDNVERNHRLGLVFEFRVGAGRLLVCASQLERTLDTVEGRAFSASLLRYMHSDAFQPTTTLDADLLTKILP